MLLEEVVKAEIQSVQSHYMGKKRPEVVSGSEVREQGHGAEQSLQERNEAPVERKNTSQCIHTHEQLRVVSPSVALGYAEVCMVASESKRGYSSSAQTVCKQV